jgi:O-antigen/teichoic acid export membrane protein
MSNIRTLSWWVRWTKIIGGFSVMQAGVQVLNGLTGFLLVRAMGKDEYAWFTIVNSLLATINILTDSGLGSAFSSIGGPIHDDRPKFAALLAFTRRLRLVFMGVSLVVTLPIGAYILQLNEAPRWTVAVLVLIIVASALPAMDISLLMAANRLQSRLANLLRADYTASLIRLMLVFFGRYAGMGAALASLVTAAAQWAQLFLLRGQTRDLRHLPEGTGADEFKAPVLAVVQHMLPVCIFQCVQGQIATWVLSFFANTSTVADVGALARLGIVMAFLFVPLQNIVFPAIARASDQARLRKLATFALAGALGVSVSIVLGGIACSQPILWLLGPRYMHLTSELAWYMGMIALGYLSHAVWGIALTRGWVRHGWLHIPVTIVLQIAGACVLNLGIARDAIIFAAIGNLAGIAVAGVLVGRGLKAPLPSPNPS